MIENLTEEELNSDIDLIRKIFSDEQDIFSDFDSEYKREGIKEKYLKTRNKMKKIEILKKKKEIKIKFKVNFKLKLFRIRKLIKGKSWINKVPRR